MVLAWMLYKIKNFLFANQILPDANLKMDGLAPTRVVIFLFCFVFFLISLPSKSLLGLERSRIGIMPLVLFGKSHCYELNQIRDHERKKEFSFPRGFGYNQFVSAEKCLSGEKKGQLAQLGWGTPGTYHRV